MSEIKNDLNELGNNIIKDAKANVPVRSGALKKSLSFKTNINSDDSFKITISELSYGKYVNSGTRKQKAQPFLTNAVEQNLPEGIQEITKTITQDVLKNILNKGE